MWKTHFYILFEINVGQKNNKYLLFKYVDKTYFIKVIVKKHYYHIYIIIILPFYTYNSFKYKVLLNVKLIT